MYMHKPGNTAVTEQDHTHRHLDTNLALRVSYLTLSGF